MSPKPSLQLELDEHSADAGLITRLEAFLESLKHYKPRKEQEMVIPQQKEQVNIGTKRKWYVPYMGDAAFGLAAAFRACGQPAEAMPIADEATLLEGRAYTTGKECLPCAITTGDMLKVIRSKDFDPKRSAFFMPSASGPCRFGMYNCMLKYVLKCIGREDVTVVSPNQDSSFYEELTRGINAAEGIRAIKGLWISVIGLDLLQKLLLRLRPFAKDSRQVQAVYQKSLNRWVQAVEKRTPVKQMQKLMADFAADFETIELDRSVMKPRVGIVGEIYVRSHSFANDNVIDRLEKLGAVCELASLAEWIYYTNFIRSRMSLRNGQWRNLITNTLQDSYQRRIEKYLAKPLEKKFGALAEGPVRHTIELAAPYIHETFEGEAILSVGKTVEFHHQGVGGVVNVMPFTCMPSTIVSTQTGRISADCRGMPILNLSFDGQEDPALTTRLEAFVEQVCQRQRSVVTVGELITA
jgi:predicted nucleotide-binding protein (sugar kinase/HSP70/actin superfamily)